MRLAALACVALPVLTGCVELRTEFAPQTGEPMQVFDQTRVLTGTQAVATGQSETRDYNGRVVATTTHYQNQLVSWEHREWYPMQGGRRIDDESFFRITNDAEAAEAYDSYHRRGKTRSLAGLIVGGVGLGLFAGGIGMYAADAPKQDAMGFYSDRTGLSTGGYLCIVAGIGATAGGLALYFTGRRAAAHRDIRLFREPERMKADADRYNAQLSAAPAPR